MDLFLFQNAEEIESAKKIQGEPLEKFQIIACSPFAVDGLKKQSIDFTTLSDYSFNKYNPLQLEKQYEIYREWCLLLDKYIYDNVVLIKRLKINPILNKLLALRYLFSTYFDEIDRLYTLIEGKKPTRILYFWYSESVLCQVIDTITNANEWNVKFVRINANVKYKSLIPDNEPVPYWFNKVNIFRIILRYIFKIYIYTYKSFITFIEGLIGYRLYGDSRKYILVLEVGYSLDELLIKLKRKSRVKMIFWEDVIYQSKKNNIITHSEAEKIINDFRKDSRAHKWTTKYNTDFFDLFIPTIKNLLKNEISIFFSTAEKFRKLNNKFNFSLVISEYQTTQSEVIFDQCVHLKIPVALFLHGGTIGFINHVDIAWFSSNINKESKYYHLVYSKIIADYYNNIRTRLPFIMPTAIPIGSIFFEKLLKQDLNSREKTNQCLNICYVCSPLGNYNAFFNKGIYDDASLYNMRYEIVDILKNQTNLKVYYKLGYNTEKFGLELERNIIQNQLINIEAIPSNTRLSDFLDIVDLFILEVPSTTLFEVLTTKKHVITLLDTRAISITDDARNLLNKRAMIVESYNEFINTIHDVAENHTNAKVFTDTNPKDQNFILKYATCGDFQSVKRSVDFIDSLLGQK